MADNGNDENVKIFPVETAFQKQARRPGGVPRERALKYAAARVEEAKPEFDDWLGKELEALADVVRKMQGGKAPPDWVEAANRHSRHLRDVGTTMGSELLTYIAGSLCEILDEIAGGAACNANSIALPRRCFVPGAAAAVLGAEAGAGAGTDRRPAPRGRSRQHVAELRRRVSR